MAAPAHPGPPVGAALHDLEREQRECADFYNQYRAGFFEHWSEPARRQMIAGYRIRRAGTYGEGKYKRPELVHFKDGSTLYDVPQLRADNTVWANILAARKDMQTEEDWYYGVDPRVGDRMRYQRVTPNAITPQALEAASNLVMNITRHTNLKFVRIIGAGGLGVVALFSSSNRAGRHVQFYVVKTVLEHPLDAEHAEAVRDLRDERRSQRLFAGAMHTVQSYERPQRQLASFRRNRVAVNNAIRIGRRGALQRTRNPLSDRLDERHVDEVQVYRRGRKNVDPPGPPAQRVPGPGVVVPPVPPATQIHPPTPPRPMPAQAPFGDRFQALGCNLEERETLLLEYLPRGDLFNFIIKLDVANIPVPNRVLWSIWTCFLRMVIAMRYPPRANRQANNHDKFGPLECEQPRPQSFNHIHFDIDPKNILVGDFHHGGVTRRDPAPANDRNDTPPARPASDPQKDPHHYVPCMKLADFGVMQLSWDKNSCRGDAGNAFAVQEQRRQGKFDIRVPEQFTKEWEWVRYLPGRKPRPGAPANPNNPNLAAGVPDHAHPVDTAGLYTDKTNLYQLALTMYCVITKRRPPQAPIATTIDLTIRQRAPAATATNPTPTRPPAVTSRAYTYGGYLLNNTEFPNTDRQLREAIAQSMCEKPGDRPDPFGLLAQATDKMAYYAAADEYHENPARAVGTFPHLANPNGPANPSSEAAVDGTFATTRAWSRQHFGDPPPYRLRNPAALQTWLAGIVPDPARPPGRHLFPAAPNNLQNLPWLP